MFTVIVKITVTDDEVADKVHALLHALLQRNAYRRYVPLEGVKGHGVPLLCNAEALVASMSEAAQQARHHVTKHLPRKTHPAFLL